MSDQGETYEEGAERRRLIAAADAATVTLLEVALEVARSAHHGDLPSLAQRARFADAEEGYWKAYDALRLR